MSCQTAGSASADIAEPHLLWWRLQWNLTSLKVSICQPCPVLALIKVHCREQFLTHTCASNMAHYTTGSSGQLWEYRRQLSWGELSSLVCFSLCLSEFNCCTVSQWVQFALCWNNLLLLCYIHEECQIPPFSILDHPVQEHPACHLPCFSSPQLPLWMAFPPWGLIHWLINPLSWKCASIIHFSSLIIMNWY